MNTSFIQWNGVKPYLSGVCDVVKLLLWGQAGWEREVEVLNVIVHALKEAAPDTGKLKSNMEVNVTGTSSFG